MRKSAWLLSAALFTYAAPTFAQSSGQSNTDTDQAGAEPTQGATAEAAAVDNQAVEQQSIDTSDIVVTATRRNEALSDVPMAVSAVTAQTLENSGASDIRQLNQLSPSLLVSSTSSEAGAGVARIRGIGTVGDNPGLESSVGVFIDGVYRNRTGMGLTELGALDRIEVLRGPQGTLFGRNTSAGLISIITAKPRFQPMFSMQLDAGNYDFRRAEWSFTGPLASALAWRIDGVVVKRDGFLKDVMSGRRINDRNRVLVRGQLLYQPAENFSLRLTADATKRREECCGAPYLPARDTLGVGGEAVEAPSTIAYIERALGAVIMDDPFDRKTSITLGRNYASDVNDGGISAEMVWDLGPVEMTSISAYRTNNYIRGQDADFNNLDILFRDDDGGSANRFRTATQELRFQGKGFGDRLDWLVGGYFSDERMRVKDNLEYGNDYSRYANCLVANNFSIITGVPALLAPGTPTCFNPNPVVLGLALPNVPASQLTVFSAFARLGAFAGAPFGNSGFTNLARALAGVSLPMQAGINDRWNQKGKHWALFTHNIFEVTDRLKVTVGARYTHERKKLTGFLTDNNNVCNLFSGGALAGLQTLPCVIPGIPGGVLNIRDDKTEGQWSGTGVISYKPMDRLLTYASYSRGYKAGGFNLDRSALWRATAAPGTPPLSGNGAICVTSTQAGCQGIVASGADLKFKPEINNAFEVGAKYNGNGFDVNLAVFHQLFRNFQLNTFNGLNFFVENINSCSEDLNNADEDNNPRTGVCDRSDTRSGVRSYGFEVEAFTRPLPNLQVNAGVVMANTRYRNNLVGADGRAISNALFQLPGRRLSNSNEWTGTASVTFTPPIGGTGMRALFYVDGRAMSAFNTGSDLDLEKKQKAFQVVNARVGVHGPDDNWAIELWGQNLFDEDFMQVAFDAPIQGSCTTRGAINGFCPAPTPFRATQLFGAFLGEPRTFGVTLRTKLGFARRATPVYEAPPAPPPPPAEVQQPAAPPPPPPPPPPPASGERGS